MARKNLDAKFEVIQDTLTNPEYKSKLGRILNEMTPSELAYVIESSPPQERKIIWDLIQLDTEGEVLGELDENLRDDLLEGMDPKEISKAISDLEVDDLADILQSLPDKITNEVLSLMNSRDRGRVENILDFPEESAGGLMNTDVITVRPENCEMDFQIKKSEIALNAADARPSRWTGGEKVDVGIKELLYDKRKVTLSIKYLEEQARDIALKTHGSESTGKNLPFSNLSEDLKKKEEK